MCRSKNTHTHTIIILNKVNRDSAYLSLYLGSSSFATEYSGSDSTSLNRLFTASRRVAFMVLIPSSASFSRVRARLKTVILGMTSATEADEELTSLVSSSIGARTLMVFPIAPIGLQSMWRAVRIQMCMRSGVVSVQ